MTPRDTHPASDPGPGAPEREAVPPADPPAPEAALGLRLRIWLACLAGALIPAAGFWWVAGTQLTLRPDPPQLLGWLVALAGLGLVVAIAFALWLDHGIVSHLRGLTRGLASGRVQELRGLPSASGWGELSELTEWAQVLITRQRFSNRATEELERLETALGLALVRLEGWRLTNRWEPLPAESGPLGDLARELNDSFASSAEVDDQNLEAARRVKVELAGAAADARDFAAQAERGFVEATALLTTVRELQRLAGELQQVSVSPAATAADAARGTAPVRDRAAVDAGARHREAVEAALEELIASSNESVEHLGVALRRVQDIATQVQVVSQRATLVALHAVTLESRLPREERRGDELSRELRLLTGEVRAASQHADALAAEVERETRAADSRMRELRERVAPKLAPLAPMAGAAVAPPESAAVPPRAGLAAVSPDAATLSDSTLRLLERVREMIQDATQKGERLSAAGERASRTAEKLVRRLEDETREVEGLMVRLAPGGRLEQDDRGAEGDLPASAAELRLLDAEGASEAADDARDAVEPEPGAREERP